MNIAAAVSVYDIVISSSTNCWRDATRVSNNNHNDDDDSVGCDDVTVRNPLETSCAC